MGHGGSPYENPFPKHTDFNPDEVPDLVKLKKKLAEKGLKDPWMRNEVHRYQLLDGQGFWSKVLETMGGVKCLGRGLAIGAVGAVVWNLTRDEHPHKEGEGEHH